MVNKGFAIVGVVIIGFLFIAVVLPGLGDIAIENSMNFSVDVYGTNNGQRITPPLAFISGGSEVDTLVCDANWEARGSGVDWSTLVISGDFKIELLDYQGYVNLDITNQRMDFLHTGDPAKTGDVHFALSLDNLLIGQPFSGATSGGEQYWTLLITYTVYGQVDQEVGGVPSLTDSLEDSISYTFYWVDGEFGIGGGIGR